jgi:hypothetical protein
LYTFWMKLFFMDTTQVHFGQLIENLVREKGDDIDTEAQKWGFQRNNLYKIFHKQDLNTEHLRRACEIYRVDMAYFLAGGRGVNQVGKANIGGSGNIQYKGEANTLSTSGNVDQQLHNENERLKEQVKSLTEQNQLLREMVEILKAKT